jgi:Uma2 family endonuclease
MTTNLTHLNQNSFELKPKGTPPLESGDRLTRYEFERRYEAATHIRKAELIEGVVYVASPLRHEQHGMPHSRVMTWLGVYQAFTTGVDLSDAPTVRLDLDNEPQPDAVLFIKPSAGGQIRISSDGYIEGTPELIVEIAASSAAIDTGSKKQAYRRNGVQEYIIWQSYENQLDWFQLVEGDYQKLVPSDSDIICSQVFPGLRLAVDELLKNNMVRVLEVLQAGLQSPAHQAFVQQLGFVA